MRLFGFFGRKKRERLAKPEMEFRKKVTKRKFLAFPPESRSFVRENRGLLVPTYRLIAGNINELYNGKTVRDKSRGIVVKKGGTGEYLGGKLPLEVTAGKRRFFVKVSSEDPKEVLARLEKQEKVLAERGHSLDGFNIRIMKPLFLYTSPNKIKVAGLNLESHLTLQVSDFFDKRDVKQVFYVRGESNRRPVYDVLRKYVSLFAPGEIHWSALIVNSFFERKTNTIWLFDMMG